MLLLLLLPYMLLLPLLPYMLLLLLLPYMLLLPLLPYMLLLLLTGLPSIMLHKSEADIHEPFVLLVALGGVYNATVDHPLHYVYRVYKVYTVYSVYTVQGYKAHTYLNAARH